MPDLNGFKELVLSINSIGGSILIGFFTLINIYQKINIDLYRIPSLALMLFGIGVFLFLITYGLIYISFDGTLSLLDVAYLKLSFWSSIISLVSLLVSVGILIF